MKKGLTHIAILLDRSSSMQTIKSATLEGLNTFLDEQRQADGQAWLSVAQFSDTYELTSNAVDLKKFKNFTDEDFIPRGSTALLDSLSRLVDDVGVSCSNLLEDERPEQIIVVVFTDGQENCSKRTTLAALKEKIKHQEEVYSWKFLFLSAGLDAAGVGNSMGIRGIAFDASQTGMKNSADYASAYVGAMRSGKTEALKSMLLADKVEDAKDDVLAWKKGLSKS